MAGQGYHRLLSENLPWVPSSDWVLVEAQKSLVQPSISKLLVLLWPEGGQRSGGPFVGTTMMTIMAKANFDKFRASFRMLNTSCSYCMKPLIWSKETRIWVSSWMCISLICCINSESLKTNWMVAKLRHCFISQVLWHQQFLHKKDLMIIYPAGWRILHNASQEVHGISIPWRGH